MLLVLGWFVSVRHPAAATDEELFIPECFPAVCGRKILLMLEQIRGLKVICEPMGS